MDEYEYEYSVRSHLWSTVLYLAILFPEREGWKHKVTETPRG